MNLQNNNRNTASVFQCALQVVWSVEQDSILIINAVSGVTGDVGYPGAAIWDMLMLGYPRQNISRIIALLEGDSMEKADAIVDEHITGWKKTGFLTEE
jgi:hypothetical protein